MQQLNFPNGDSTLSLSIPNTISTSTTCTVSVAVKLDTTTGFTLVMRKNTTSLGTQVFSAASSSVNNTGFTTVSMTFTVPSSGNLTLAIFPDSTYNVGSIYTSNWCIYTGTPQTTTIRGNLSIPYGNITTNDVIYGPNTLSLTNEIYSMQLATQGLAPLDSPQFTGNVTGIDKIMVGLSNVDNIADSSKVFSENQITNLVVDLASKANQSTTYTKIEVDTSISSLPSKSYVDGSLNTINLNFSNYYNKTYVDGSLNTISGKLTTINNSISSLNTSVNNTYPKTYIDGSLNTIKNQLGIASIITTALGDNVDTINATLLTKASNTSPTISGTITTDAITTNNIIYSNGTITAATNFAVYGTSLMQGNLTMQYPATIVGISNGTVGLGNVDNTSDLNKPVSNATQTALNLKAPINNPQFTGTISSNKFLVDATGNLTAFSLTSNNNLTCTDVLYAGGTSLTQTLANLAPSSSPIFTGTLSIKTGTYSVFSVDNYANLKCDGIGSIKIMDGTIANFSVDFPGNIFNKGSINSTGNINTVGDITYNDGTSITQTLDSMFTSLASCVKKTSGTFAATTTFQAIYTITSGTRGFITITSTSATNRGMITLFFEGTANLSYASLTQIACSGNSTQAVINPTSALTGGTQTIFAQIHGGGYSVQVRVSTACTVSWSISLL
jgi:hypothetical protein